MKKHDYWQEPPKAYPSIGRLDPQAAKTKEASRRKNKAASKARKRRRS